MLAPLRSTPTPTPWITLPPRIITLLPLSDPVRLMPVPLPVPVMSSVLNSTLPCVLRTSRPLKFPRPVMSTSAKVTPPDTFPMTMPFAPGLAIVTSPAKLIAPASRFSVIASPAVPVSVIAPKLIAEPASVSSTRMPPLPVIGPVKLIVPAALKIATIGAAPLVSVIDPPKIRLTLPPLPATPCSPIWTELPPLLVIAPPLTRTSPVELRMSSPSPPLFDTVSVPMVSALPPVPPP